MLIRLTKVLGLVMTFLIVACSQEAETPQADTSPTSAADNQPIMTMNSGAMEEGNQFFQYENLMASQGGALKDADVIEFFSYGCGHCQKFAPELEAWHKKNSSKKVAYVPVVWNQQTALYARVFYSIEGLTNFDEVHHEMFKLFATFGQEKSVGEQIDKILNMLTEKGVDADKVKATLESRALEEKLKNSVVLAKHYEITGTPTLVVQGEKRINNKALYAKGDLMRYVDRLLTK